MKNTIIFIICVNHIIYKIYQILKMKIKKYFFTPNKYKKKNLKNKN